VIFVVVFGTEAGKKSGAKPRDESMIDKKHELEKRLENVKGALGAPSKKPTKKGLSLKLLPLHLGHHSSMTLRFVFSRPFSFQRDCDRHYLSRAKKRNGPR